MIPVRLLLFVYASFWRVAWPVLRLLARLDRLRRRRSGRGLFPDRWLPARRLLEVDAPLPGHGLPTLWMHAASLGECKGLWALAEGLLRESQGSAFAAPGSWRLLLTAVTAEGLDFLEARLAGRMREPGAPGHGPTAAATLAPLDHPGRVDRFLAAQHIAHVVLYEADLWPHYILRSGARGIPVDLAAARLTGRAFRRFRPLHRLWSHLLDRLDWIQAQGRLDADRLRGLTRRPIHPGADFKASHPLRAAAVTPASHRNPQATYPARLAFLSLHLPELRLLLPEFPALMARFPLTVFPRLTGEMEAFRRLLLPLGFVLHRDADAMGSIPSGAARHVLVDALGRVHTLLPSCAHAFVGGSLVERGAHNLWEPLGAGLLVHVGPSVFNQEEAVRLAMDRGLAEILRKPADLRNLRAPGPEIPAACRAFLQERMVELEAAESAFRARAAAAVSARGFYLFSGKPGAPEMSPAG